MNVPTECPACKADLKGTPIPMEYWDDYDTAEYYSRVIGIYDRDKDRTTHWRCPDCNHEWRRE